MKTVEPEDATVFIVDDDDDARQGLRRFLDSCGYQTEAFSSAKAFLARLPVGGIGCLVLDLQMPEMSGMELQQELARAGIAIPIVFLTGHGDIPTSVKAIKRGAEDFLPKLADEQDLLDAIERALQKCKNLLASEHESVEIRRRASTLTERELEVCRYVIAGTMNKKTARVLGIAQRTVKAHRAKVMKKFGVVSIAELVRVAEQAGIEPAEVPSQARASSDDAPE